MRMFAIRWRYRAYMINAVFTFLSRFLDNTKQLGSKLKKKMLESKISKSDIEIWTKKLYTKFRI